MTESVPEDSSPQTEGRWHKLRRHSRTIISLIAIVLALAVAFGIFYAVTRGDSDKISGTWKPTLDTPTYSNAAQILLAKNGRRLVVIPRWESDNNNNMLMIYDQKTRPMMAAESAATQVTRVAYWYWHSELPREGLAAISGDGLTIAILGYKNITILRDISDSTDDEYDNISDDKDGSGRWEQIGQAIMPADVFAEEDADPAINASNFGFIAPSSSMVLSEDGSLLTLWLGPDRRGILVSFRRPDDQANSINMNHNHTNNGTWERKHRENGLVSSLVHETKSEQYLAASGDALALGLYLGGVDDIMGELMRVYNYGNQTTADNSATSEQPHSHWFLAGTFVERPGQNYDSRFGKVGDISYDGSVVAVSSSNFHLGTQRNHFQYGFVTVYHKTTSGRSYTQRGQTIEASPECVIGKLVALSKDGNRMAIYNDCRLDSVQAYEFQPKQFSSGGGAWKKLGDAIVRPREALHLAMSADGMRMAIVWTEGTMVYELE